MMSLAKARPSWSQLGPSSTMTGVLVREGKFGCRGECDVKAEAETGLMLRKARSAWGRQKPEGAKKDSLLETSKGAWPCRNLDLGLLASRSQENTLLLI